MDVYQAITDNIIKSIEDGVDGFIMPWHRAGANQIPVNIKSGNDYQGINILNLWITAQVRTYSSNLWGTYKQWQDVDAQVRKGEKSSLIIFYKKLTFKNDQGEDEERHMIRPSWL